MKTRLINYNLWQRSRYCAVFVCIYKKMRLQTEKVGAPKSAIVAEKTPVEVDSRH